MVKFTAGRHALDAELCRNMTGAQIMFRSIRQC